MELQTKITIPSLDRRIDYQSKIMTIGSCFAENIGKKFEFYRFFCDINPCGIVYNPLSVANVLECILNNRCFEEKDLLENNGKWVSLYHHGNFSSADKAVCLKNINDRLELARAHIKEVDWLMITFGTAWVYKYKLTGGVVSNCHRFPASDFHRYRLNVSDIVEVYSELIRRLRALNPGLNVLFTVSPIRHWKDGAHENQLSKAVLLLAIEELMKMFPKLLYFPSYEIVMDELRDYRFYAGDMLHISDTGIDYIWNCLKACMISESVYETMRQVEKINKGLLHIPEDVNSVVYREFRQKLLDELGTLKKAIPALKL